jgi:hypothetical protein
MREIAKRAGIDHTTFAGRAASMKRPLQQLLHWLEGDGAASAAQRAPTRFQVKKQDPKSLPFSA